MLRTKNASRVSISGLTYNNLIEDAYNALKDSDEFKNNFTSFTSNSAERMIVELYAYVASQLANRMDQMGNELFVDTASANGLSRLMKLIGARLEFPAAAETKVKVSTSTPTSKIVFTSGINTSETELNFVSSSFKKITANNGTSWEFIKKEVGENGEFVYDYTAPCDFSGSSKEFILQQGSTQARSDYVINSVNIDTITLVETPVIKNSVRIYYKDKVLKEGTPDTYEVKEMKRVDNFFTTDALTANTGIYTVRNMGGGRCEISIKPYDNEVDGISDLGRSLLIMYRTGGGDDGNISIGAIDLVEQFTILGDSNKTTGYGQLTIENVEGGVGGENELTADQIRATVLQEVRNTKIAITEEDYEYLLPKYDSSIELIKCYGEKNDETADLSETYGYYVNPLNVWLIILKYNKEFNDAYMSDVSSLTDRINDIAFSILDINPRFNEKYQINSAYLNQIYRSVDLDEYFNEETHSYSFPIDEDGVKLLGNKDCKITVTNYPYIETAESSRRGINSFKRYDGIASLKTWADLKALTYANKGDAYLITTVDEAEDGTKNIYDRWICKEFFYGHVLTDEEFYQHWEKADFSYIYDNLVSDNLAEDRMWIQQSTDSADSFYPVYSDLPYSFSGNWDILENSSYYKDGVVNIPAGVELRLIINGQVILITGPTEIRDLEDLANIINSKLDPTTNIIFLKENIPQDPTSTIIPNENYVAGPANLVIEVDGVTYTVNVDPTNVNTYNDLIDRINSSLESNGLGDKILAVEIENNDCLNLALISGSAFTYKDGETDGYKAIYTYLLDNEEPAEGWPLKSSILKLDADAAEIWSDYLASTGTLAYVEYGQLRLGFEDDMVDFVITGNSDIAALFKRFFGFSDASDDEEIRYRRRVLSVAYSNTTASLMITMSSADDLLHEDIYINIFGPRNGEIKLGSYYENIDQYLTDAPEVVVNLLKRGPIRHLYSTSYIPSETGDDIVDRYGSSYKLKFSTGLIEEETFSQLSSGNFPAEITTRNEVNSTFPDYDEGSELLIKVDNIEYDGTGSFILRRGDISEIITVPAHNGYAKFDLSWFNGKSTLVFIQSLVYTFEHQGADSSPLLKYEPTLDNTIRMYTVSSSFYSSIDFGNTSLVSLYLLFGLESGAVLSKEGQILANEIDYKTYSMTNSLAMGKTIHIEVRLSELGELISADVPIGYNLQNFISNLNSSAVGPYVAISNLRLVFLSLSNKASINVRVEWNSITEHDVWEGMFTPETWSKFIPVNDSTDAEGAAECMFVNDGDYYIYYDGTDYNFIVQNPDAFPYGDIYFHMYEDYSKDHIVEETEEIVRYTDEYIWNSLMTKKRVMLTEHVYKQPRFIPFDLSVICVLPNTESYSSTDYNTEITNHLKTVYGLYSDNIGEEILPDDIIFSIKEKFPKVKKVIVEYLGYDISNQATNKESLTTEFNQKHILASTKKTENMVIDETTHLVKQQTIMKHGLKLALKYATS